MTSPNFFLQFLIFFLKFASDCLKLMGNAHGLILRSTGKSSWLRGRDGASVAVSETFPGVEISWAAEGASQGVIGDSIFGGSGSWRL